jgi:hypothetical protein
VGEELREPRGVGVGEEWKEGKRSGGGGGGARRRRSGKWRNGKQRPRRLAAVWKEGK